MKRCTTLRFLFLAMIHIVLASCINIKEDRSDCPPIVDPSEIVKTISFEYVGDANDPTMFSQKISRVTMLVYDQETDLLVSSQELDGSDFIADPKASVQLEAGNYHIVCWANMSDQTMISDEPNWSDASVAATDYSTNYTGNDPLYVGDMEVALESKGYVEGTIRFHSAHINIDVLIDNPAWGAANTDSYPIVTLDHLMPMYDLVMNDMADYDAVCTPKLTYDSSRNYVEADFNVFRFKDDNNCVLTLRNTAGDILSTTDLSTFMSTNNLSVDNGSFYDYMEDVTITILIKFYPTTVTVTFPEWAVKPAVPTTKLSFNLDDKSTRVASSSDDLAEGRTQEKKITNMLLLLTNKAGVIKQKVFVNPNAIEQTGSTVVTNPIRCPFVSLDTEYYVYAIANYTQITDLPEIGDNVKDAIISTPDESTIATDNFFPMTTCEAPLLVKFNETNDETNPAVPYKDPSVSGADDIIDLSRLASRIDYVVDKADNIYTISDDELRVVSPSDGMVSEVSLDVQLLNYRISHLQKTSYLFGRTVDTQFITSDWSSHWSLTRLLDTTFDQYYQVDPYWSIKQQLNIESKQADAAEMMAKNQWTNTVREALPVALNNSSNVLGYCTENVQPGTVSQQRGVSTTLELQGEIILPDNMTVTDAMYVYGKRIYLSYESLVDNNLLLKTALGSDEPIMTTTIKKKFEDEGVARFTKSETNNHRFPVKYYVVIKHFDNNNNALMGPMEFATVRNFIYQLRVKAIPLLGHPLSKDDPDPITPDPNDPDEKSTAQLTLETHALPWVESYKNIEW